jgi:hypothetical protein
LLKHLISRLRLANGAQPLKTISALHGKVRFQQGYSVAMLIEESRLLQVSIFATLHHCRKDLDPERLMLDVAVIADECDAELKDTVKAFLAQDKHGKGAST